MSNIAVSRKTPANRKGNKENAQPGDGVKSFIRRDFSKSTSAVSVQCKSNRKQEILVRNGVSKITSKIQDTKSTSGEVLKGKSTHKDGNGGAVCEVEQPARNRAILAEQIVKNEKVVTDTTRAPVAVASSKFAPGLYKGKIVESKIGSLWKSSATARGAGSKPAPPKTESQKVVNLTKSRSKSVADVPGRNLQKSAPTTSKSLLDGRAQASKPGPSGRLPGPRSARPPTSSTVPATLRPTSSRNTTAAPTKPKVAITDKKVKKPPVTSTLSQYRCTETTEERRAKLAVWLASKGKTLKRPAMTSTRTETKISASVNPKASMKSQAHVKGQQDDAKTEPEPSLGQPKPEHAAQEAPETVEMQPPVKMNTSFGLENFDLDLPAAQDGFDDVVLNLCDVLEAMQTPSKYQDELPQSTDMCNIAEEEEGATEDGCVKDVSKNVDAKEMLTDESKKKVLMDEEVQCDDSDMDSVPQMGHAYVVKYSIKTTPYLQSVKKTIEGEVQTSTSRRKSNIKDLKFLTPVRRSRRIERKSSYLPSSVLDHDPCVSSLAELVKLDDSLNAYVYRKNSALTDDLPDQVKL
ncbi:cytoskeleton-associated protein 2 [Hippocampus comes]|uniref:Cytoskeleton-associated protein 2-like n=1 Tax=Hippocampus comes TaxID=109280 RepID=A0A3Q3DYQ0_HIPCM|nr:PREDICTED: cytoskeleton-associated protein 2-like [Hippocampus comes]XP_019750814.1 PREDICTED: cytoskeleton-associated protein 2-like [Hippocampus comes]